MITFTKEQLIASAHARIEFAEMMLAGELEPLKERTWSIELKLARIALASLEAEAVDSSDLGAVKFEYTGAGDYYGYGFYRDGVQVDVDITKPLYTAPPVPVYDSLISELLAIAKKAAEDADVCAHAEWNDDSMEHSTAISDWEHRAAMLQGADRPQNEPQNIPENIPATHFKPVADLYGLTSPTGGETSFTFDAVEARDFIDGGWSCQEYVELGRFLEDVSGNSPVIPDGWVACSERMPDRGKKVLIRISCSDHFNIESGEYKGDGLWLGCWFDTYGKKGSAYQVAHWMPLPTAPQQEVKP